MRVRGSILGMKILFAVQVSQQRRIIHALPIADRPKLRRARFRAGGRGFPCEVPVPTAVYGGVTECVDDECRARVYGQPPLFMLSLGSFA